MGGDQERDEHNELRWRKDHWTSWHQLTVEDPPRIPVRGEGGGRGRREREGDREEEGNENYIYTW